jgi:hypothetical protein
MAEMLTLVANSGIQFVDIDLDMEKLPRVTGAFWEERISEVRDASGALPVVLRTLKKDDTGTLYNEETGHMPDPNDPACYSIGRAQAVEMMMNRWVPLPFLRALAPDLFDRGPSNWVRGRLAEHPDRAGGGEHAAGKPTHRLTLAFDTRLEVPVGRPWQPNTPYARNVVVKVGETYLKALGAGVSGPGPAPAGTGASITDGTLSWRAVPSRDVDLRYVAPGSPDVLKDFAFVAQTEKSGWFIDQKWVGNWLEQMFRDLLMAKSGGRAIDASSPRACEHYARYLVYLSLLDDSRCLPKIKLLEPVEPKSGRPSVPVDLVLDIGNARTCGILIEELPGQGQEQGQDLTRSYKLALRELSRPEQIEDRPFDSRVEFAMASFGNEAFARDSGRDGSFAWPSPVRVGPEAARLAGTRIGNEGATGLSSPKRYLWDERQAALEWRANGRAADPPEASDVPINGPFMGLMDEKGDVHRPKTPGRRALEARFSRSAIFTFMLVEILMQAMSQMNSPATRAEAGERDIPRRLRTVLITVPPGMPVAERRILRRRAQDAVRLTWAMLGWTEGLPEPAVRADLDEATATQIVWLHNEVTERLKGDAAALLEIVGKPRPEVDKTHPCLRVASIDIGGGTTDIMVTTYAIDAEGKALVPRQDFRDSFKIAGDDVLERVISQIVLPSLEDAMRAAGVNDPRAVLARKLGPDRGGMGVPERHLRRLFVSMVLEPIGLAVLHAYEQIEGRAAGEILRTTVGGILGVRALAASARARRYLEEAAEASGGQGFEVAAAEIRADTRQVERVTRDVLEPVLADLCEATWKCDCDVLLLSGRPSRMRVVADMVLAKTPVPVRNIIGMHRYKVGGLYPFKDAQNRIDDPKTTAAVGAALCVQAGARLRNFTLRTRHLTMRSTARIMGEMANDGQILDKNVLLRNVDLDGPPAQDVGFTVSFQAPMMIGFRQLPIERWTATPLYALEWSSPDNVERYDLPMKVAIRRREIDENTDQDHAGRETFYVESVEDAQQTRHPENIVRLRLQTLDDPDGYWRDTGRLTIIT